MKRLSILGLGASMMSAIGSFGMVRGGIDRVASGTKRARQMNDVRPKRHRSKYMPHYGAKEQERARRCYMRNGILHQRSKLVQEFHDAAESWF